MIGVVALVVVGIIAASVLQRENCESVPFEQFRLNGVTYWGPTTAIERNVLDQRVGVITKKLPKAASECRSFTLVDGQGSAIPGSEVFTISGKDSALWLAVVDPSTGRARQYHSTPVP